MEEMAIKQLTKSSMGFQKQLLGHLVEFVTLKGVGQAAPTPAHSITLSLLTPRVNRDSNSMMKIATLIRQYFGERLIG